MFNYIINNNLFRLLRAGAFAEKESLEPMSTFKWNRLLQIAEVQDVAEVVKAGLTRCKDDRCIDINNPVFSAFFERTDTHHTGISGGNINYGKVRLSNSYLNWRLKKILKESANNEDVTKESLQLLLMIVHNTNQTLNRGITLKGIIELGLFLRNSGHKVNFVALESWLQKLGLVRMANLQVTVLTEFLHFDNDEIPFMQREEPTGRYLTQKSLVHTAEDTAENWHFRMRTNGMVENNNRVLRRNLRRSMRYMRFNPFETTSNFFSSFARSLSEIEE